MAEDRKHREREPEQVYFVTQLFERLRQESEQNRNPLCAWFAYLAARKNGRTPPAWTLRYLDEVASGMWELYERVEFGWKISHKDIAKAVKLVGTRGKGNAFSSFDTMWMYLAEKVGFNISQGDKETYAIEDVAKRFGANKSTIRRYWKRYQAEYPERVSELLSSTKRPIL